MQTSVVAAAAAEGPWGLGLTEAATEAETAVAVSARRDGSRRRFRRSGDPH